MTREAMRLLQIGVPWSEVWTMSRARKWAFIVAAGEIEGGSYDWNTQRWREPKS